MALHMTRYGLRNNNCENMKKLKDTLGLNDLYPKSATVLLWIGTAVAALVGANWTMIHSHHHVEYITGREFTILIDAQKATQDRIEHLTDTIFDQTMIMNELKGRVEWLTAPER